jgi:hypothetical protein
MLFLPWLSRRAAAAMVPSALILSTASDSTMHTWGSYFPIPLVPFALFGLIEVLARARQAENVPARTLATIALLLSPLFGPYARSVPWDRDRLEALAAVKSALPADAKVYAQTAVFPHLGYPREAHVIIDTSRPPTDAFIITNETLSAWPVASDSFAQWQQALRSERTVREFPGGFLLFAPR